MLTYTPPEQRSAPDTHEKPWLLLLLVFAWLWPGVFSHGLWNPSEPEVLTAVEALRSGAQPWVAEVLGQPDFSIPPVYVWLAAALQALLTPWALDAYAAVRLTSVLFTVVGLWTCGVAGFHFLGRHHGRSVVLILIGSLGLLAPAHLMNPMSAVFAALGMVLCGFSLTKTRVIVSALLLGGGWLLLALTAGWLLPLALILLAFLLMLHPQWQFKRYPLALFGAFAVAVPLMTLYPLVLMRTAPDLYSIWLNQHIWGAFGGMSGFQTAFSLPYYLKNLLWFALPAWPLAVWTVSRKRHNSEGWSGLALAWILLASVLLAFQPQRFQENLIWLLPPLALLGAAQLDALRRGAAAFINWFGIMAFGLLAVFLWLGFAAMNYGWPAKLAERAQYFSPYYLPDIDPMPMAVALLFTPLWLWAITRRHIRGRQAVTNWAAGVTLVWALLMTLFLPWLDAAKSYQPVVQQMEASLYPELQHQFAQGHECISVDAADKRSRIAWAQYSDWPLQPDNAACRYRLVQQPKDTAAPQGWTKLWQGARPRNKTEGFALLRRDF